MGRLVKKPTLIEILFSILVALSLFLHVFNTYGFTEELKYFHVPAVIVFILSFFLPTNYDKFRIIMLLFLGWSVWASLLSPFPYSINGSVTFVIVLGGMLGVKYVRGNGIVHFCNILIPFALIALFGIYVLFKRDYFRFTGFYNDPNYLCITLLTFIILISKELQLLSIKYLKFVLLLEIGVIFFLITTTVSRTGLVCAIILISMMLYGYSKKYFLRTIVISILSVGVLYMWKGDAFRKNIEMYSVRAEQGDNYVDASEQRFNMSMRGINYVTEHPLFLLQGMGIGGVNHPQYFEDYHTTEKRIDHNTFTSIFSEQGFVGFCLYVSALSILAKSLWRRRKELDGRIELTSFVVMLLFSASINTLKYLPFWFVIFFIDRKYDTINKKVEYLP